MLSNHLLSNQYDKEFYFGHFNGLEYEGACWINNLLHNFKFLPYDRNGVYFIPISLYVY